MRATPPDIDWPALPQWRDALEAFGAVRLRGVPLDSANGPLLEVARQLGPISMRALTRHPRLLEPAGVQRIEALPDGVRDQYGKPLRSANNTHFALHTDESFHAEPARWVLLHCWSPAGYGGNTLLADACAVLAAADRPTRLAFEQIRLRYPCGDMTTFDARGRVRFNPAEIDALVADGGSSEAPRPHAWLQRFESLFANAAQQLALASGDLLVIDNWRVLHGREAFASPSDRLLKRVRVLDVRSAAGR